MISIPVSQGDVSGFNTFLYGEKNMETVEYLRNLNTQVLSAFQNVGSPVVEFFAKAREEFEQFNGDEALRKARAVLRKVDNILMPDVIMKLVDIGQIQHCQPLMQRFIMADPYIRQLYQEQRIDGWSNTYIDIEPGLIGMDQYDYCRMMNGLAVPVEKDDGSVIYRVTNYFNERAEGDVHLSIQDVFDIADTRDITSYYLKMGQEDPTNTENGML